MESNLFDRINESFDVILCNPPYVKNNAKLPVEFRHEPQLALFGGKDGLDVVRKILPGVRSHLKAGGFVLLEVGFGQTRRMKGLWPNCEFIETSAGKGPLCLLKT